MRILNKHKATEEEKHGAVYIGRGSPLGNEKVIGKDGTRLEVIAWYRGDLAQKLLDRIPSVENAFRSLNDASALLCFCAPAPCHGEVIVEYRRLFTGVSYEEGLERLRALVLSEKAAAPPTSVTPDASSALAVDPTVYLPERDGVDHINVWSRGKTALGRLCSNFAHTPFDHPTYGHFASVEGLWYFLSTGCRYNELRSLHGFEAKKVGQALRQRQKEAATEGIEPFPTVQDFELIIKKAILCKVEQNENLRHLLRDSSLPLAHYYAWGEQPPYKVTIPREFAWTYEYLERVRQWLQGRAVKLLITGSRDITDYQKVEDAIASTTFVPVEIVSGDARGADALAIDYARRHKLPYQVFLADWGPKDNTDRSAGYKRNLLMGEYCEAAVLLWDGHSSGTQHMRDILLEKKVPHELFTFSAPAFKKP